MLNKKIIAHIALFSANLIYALNYTFAKDVMSEDHIGPSGFILLRVIGAIFLFGACYFFFIKERVHKKDIFSFAICGLFGIAINQLLFFQGLHLSTPINAAIMMTSTPILVILISALLGKEQITFQKILGVTLGCFGAVVLILSGGDFSASTDYTKGNLFVLINAASYGIYLILVQPLMRKYHPITVMAMVFFFGIFYVLPFGYEELISVEWNSFSTKIIWEVVFVVVCTTFFAYFFNSSALKYLDASAVSIYIYLQPVLASLIAISLQSDQINETKILSCILIFFGVYLVSKQKNLV